MNVKHVVSAGESTQSIAMRYSVSEQDLVNSNPEKSYHIYRNRPVFDDLVEGEELTIPR